MRYRTIGRSNQISGVGRTVNISSDGMLIDAAHRPVVGSRLEVNLEWPTLLDGVIPLQMVAMARVVRCELSCFALSFGEYQFRTLSRKLLQVDPAEDMEAAEPNRLRRLVGA